MNPEVVNRPVPAQPSRPGRFRRLRPVLFFLGAAAVGSICTLVAMFFGHFFGPARVCVVNLSGSQLRNHRVEAGSSHQDHVSLASGTRVTSILSPHDSQALYVTFDINEKTRRVEAGAIGAREQRTITILENGERVIISFGEDSAVVDLDETEIVPSHERLR